MAKSVTAAILFVLLFVSLAAAQSLQEINDREYLNSHFATLVSIGGKVVDAKYIPRLNQTLEIGFVEVPVEDLVVFVAHDIDGKPLASSQQAFVTRNGKTFFRFFIHPSSTELYSELINKYGIQGYINGQPTASTRTLLVQPQEGFSEPMYIKTSMNIEQFGYGRIIPDWEVRRSILITEMVHTTPQSEWEKNGVTVIDEPVGAYVKKGANYIAYAANNQPFALSHGMINRDPSFPSTYKHLDIYPLFSLFSEGENGEEPLIVNWWRIENEKSGIGFNDYLGKMIADPVTRAIAYLVFEQGLIPDAHGQNVLVGLNPHNHTIERVFFRDIGSFKVNWILRWTKGLSIDALFKSENPQWDFKPEWADEISFRPFINYFYNYMFGDKVNQSKLFRKFVPDFAEKKVLDYILAEMELAVDKYLPTKTKSSFALKKEWIRDRFRQFYSERPPKIGAIKRGQGGTKVSENEALGAAVRAGQVVTNLPISWNAVFGRRVVTQLRTKYGILFRTKESDSPKLALVPPDKSKVSFNLDHFEGAISRDDFLGVRNGIFSRLWFRLPTFSWADGKTFEDQVYNVIRIGKSNDTRYLIYEDSARIIATYTNTFLGHSKFKINVVNDLTEFSYKEQLEILKKIANSPRAQIPESLISEAHSFFSTAGCGSVMGWL